jgi:hypothetical protein
MDKPTFIYPCHYLNATATADDTSYAAPNVLNGCEDTAWKPSNTTGAKTLIIALGGSLSVGQIAILGTFMYGSTVEIRGSSDGFVSSNFQLSAATMTIPQTITWRSFSETSCTHIKLIFSTFTSSFSIRHIAVCRAVSLPYLDDGYDPDAFQAEGTQLIGLSGTYLGATQQRTMLSLSLAFGQVTAAQYTPFEQWADACVKTMLPFFYVPDISQQLCLFGWTDAKYKFSAPYKNGLRKVSAIPFTARRV